MQGAQLRSGGRSAPHAPRTGRELSAAPGTPPHAAGPPRSSGGGGPDSPLTPEAFTPQSGHVGRHRAGAPCAARPAREPGRAQARGGPPRRGRSGRGPGPPPARLTAGTRSSRHPGPLKCVPKSAPPSPARDAGSPAEAPRTGSATLLPFGNQGDGA